MGYLASFCSGLILTTFLALPNAHAAADPSDNIKTGKRYLDTFYSFDVTALEQLLHTDAVFEDPTSAVVSPDTPSRITGRSAIIDFVRQSSKSIVNADYSVESEFSTGDFVVFSVEYSTVFDGELFGMPGREFAVRLPAITILRIQNGLVLHHLDHVNYDLMFEQMAKQSAE